MVHIPISKYYKKFKFKKMVWIIIQLCFCKNCLTSLLTFLALQKSFLQKNGKFHLITSNQERKSALCMFLFLYKNACYHVKVLDGNS